MADYVSAEEIDLLNLFAVGDTSPSADSRALTGKVLDLKPLRTLANSTQGTLKQRITELLDAERLFLSADDVLQIAIGLVHGHVILYGPPGTGKTALLRVLAKLFRVKLDQVWTANAEWTTFDVIGGLTPTLVGGKEVIQGQLGKVTSDMISCIREMKAYDELDPSTLQAAWSVVDEMNRCNLDKAFGDLFTALSAGDTETRKIALSFMADSEQQTLYVPGRFRMIGTINTYDKDFIQDFSTALARRFRFYAVNVPRKDQLDAELDLLWQKAAAVATSRLAEWGATEANLVSLKSALASVNGADFWKAFKELISFIRWEGMGVPLGSAQILEILIGFVTQLFALEQMDLVTTPADEAAKSQAEKAVINAFDVAIAESLVKQLDATRDVKKLATRLQGTAPLKLKAEGPTLTELMRIQEQETAE